MHRRGNVADLGYALIPACLSAPHGAGTTGLPGVPCFENGRLRPLGGAKARQHGAFCLDRLT
ncbi:protein of unknown function [Paraburkholderia kururiensis]